MIGLAMSSKFTAACAPLTLTLAALLHLRRDRKVLLYLVVAGVISLFTFLVLNPQLELFQRDFGWTVYDYEKHASLEETTRSEVVAGALGFSFCALRSRPDLRGGERARRA